MRIHNRISLCAIVIVVISYCTAFNAPVAAQPPAKVSAASVMPKVDLGKLKLAKIAEQKLRSAFKADFAAKTANNKLKAADTQIIDLTKQVVLPVRVSNQSAAGTVRVAIFSLTDDPAIGSGAASNSNLLCTLFATLSENCQDRFKFYTANQTISGQSPYSGVSGSDFTGDNVDATLQKIANDTQSNDTVFLYFSAHGGYDPILNDHFFQTTDGYLYSRTRALNRIRQGNPRLAVLISDSCASQVVATNSPHLMSATITPKFVYDLFYLLFYYQGVVDINSSTPPFCSYYYTDGGIFTHYFWLNAVYGDFSASTESAGGTKGWDAFFKALKNNLDNDQAAKLGDGTGGPESPIWFPR